LVLWFARRDATIARMPQTRVSALMGTYGHTAALKDGSASPRGLCAPDRGESQL